ncbi:hypothetical protein F4778DRAFT_8448 [Xylariomycetidae sp. FL2044]|nr:hypothetical protein F4778DRAFT_8448 [Xylariomycetidae sp. FL2044]
MSLDHDATQGQPDPSWIPTQDSRFLPGQPTDEPFSSDFDIPLSPSKEPKQIPDNVILKWVSPNTYASRQADFLEKRYPNTLEWFFQSETYANWVDRAQQTLLCPGIPGSGKSILAATVIEDLCTRVRHETQTSIGVAYIYCADGNISVGKSKRVPDISGSDCEAIITPVLQEVLKQLVLSTGSVPAFIRDLYSQSPKPRKYKKHWRPSAEEVLENLKTAVALHSKVFLIIDQLDRVDMEVLGLLMTNLQALRANKEINILVTTREYPDIEAILRPTAKLEISATAEDIEAYVTARIKTLPDWFRNDDTLTDEVRKLTVNNASGIYLNLLETKESAHAVQKAMQTIPEPLANVFGEAMRTLEASELAMELVSWLTWAFRPLKISELADVLETDISEMLPHWSSSSAWLFHLDVASDSIGFRLKSISTYIHGQINKGQLGWSTYLLKARATIASRCIRYLSDPVFETGPALTQEKFNQRLGQHPFYTYAAHHWGNHARISDISTEDTMEFLNSGPRFQASVEQLVCLHEANYFERSIYARRATPLHAAAYFGLEGEVNQLLQNGASVNEMVSYGDTPLLWAAKADHAEVMKVLCKGDAITLHWLAENGESELIIKLLDADYDINALDFHKRTPVNYAVQLGKLDVVKLLISRGANLELEDVKGYRPLQKALRAKSREIIEVLLEQGVTTENIPVIDWYDAFDLPPETSIGILEDGRGSLQFSSQLHRLDLSQSSLYDRSNVLRLHRVMPLYTNIIRAIPESSRVTIYWGGAPRVRQEPNLHNAKFPKLGIQEEVYPEGWCYGITIETYQPEDNPRRPCRYLSDWIMWMSPFISQYRRTPYWYITTLPYLKIPKNGLDFLD